MPTRMPVDVPAESSAAPAGAPATARRPASAGSSTPAGFDVLDANCPSYAAMRDVTGRWAPLVLLALAEGLTRFGEIHRRVGGSSERMISQTLRVLQDDAVVERTVGEDGRPSYALTATGREIACRVRDLSEAIYAHLEQRDAAGIPSAASGCGGGRRGSSGR
jgi:DNA-binding HxlR family transcriptional regulator